MPGKLHTLTREEQALAVKELEAMTYEVGAALSIWMAVEAQLNQTFHIALTARPSYQPGAVNQSTAAAIFRSAINTSARHLMVDAAMRDAFARCPDEHLEKQWKSLLRRLSDASKNRNRLAHRNVVMVTAGPVERTRKSDLFVRLVDPLDFSPDPTKQVERDLTEGCTMNDLKNMQTSFRKLAQDVFSHGQDLIARLTRP